MLQLIGILIILIALSLTAWWVTHKKGATVAVILVCSLAIFVGIFLIINERAVEITIENVGTIKAAKKEALSDAQQITEIRKRVDAQGATVDLVAKEAMEAKRLTEELSRKNELAEKKLSELDKSIQDGNLAIKELMLSAKFNSIVLAAKNDDRQAYDQLWVWSEDNLFPFQRSAVQAAQTVMDQHNPALVRGGFSVSWKEGVDPQKLTLPELRQAFRSAPPHVRIGILEFLWEKRTDISKSDRLQFLADVLRSDESLRVVEYAGRYFGQGTGNKLKPLAIGPHLQWWEENKDSVE